MSGRAAFAVRVAGAALAALTAGCAAIPTEAPFAGGGGVPADTTHGDRGVIYSPGVLPPRPYVPQSRAAVGDSAPSPAALRVLDTIPEPLPPVERVRPSAQAPPPISSASPVPSEPSDSARLAPASPAAAHADSAAPSAPAIADTAAASADTASDIPVPQPTIPLGDRPSSATPLAPAPVPPAPPPATPPAFGPPPAILGAVPQPPAAPDTCWRVQIGAPADRVKAEGLRSAGESLLLVPMEIVLERTLFKVRSRDCMGRVAADRLKERAAGSGFTGAFRFSERAK